MPSPELTAQAVSPLSNFWPQSLFEAPASAGRDWLPSPIPSSTAPYMAPPTFDFCMPPSIAYHSKRNRRLITPTSICPTTSALGVAETLLFVFFLFASPDPVATKNPEFALLNLYQICALKSTLPSCDATVLANHTPCGSHQNVVISFFDLGPRLLPRSDPFPAIDCCPWS